MPKENLETDQEIMHNYTFSLQSYGIFISFWFQIVQ
jgi:hypothetical protein